MAPQLASSVAREPRVGVAWGGILGPRRFSARLSAVAAGVLPRSVSGSGTCPTAARPGVNPSAAGPIAKIASGTPA